MSSSKCPGNRSPALADPITNHLDYPDNTNQYSRRARSPSGDQHGVDRISRAREREKGRERSPQGRQQLSYGQNYGLQYHGLSHGLSHGQNYELNYRQRQTPSYNSYSNTNNNNSHKGYGQYKPRYPKNNDSESSYRPRNDRYLNRRYAHHPTAVESRVPDTERPNTSQVEDLKVEEVIEDPQEELMKLEDRLKELTNVKSLKELKVLDSRWNVKPQGFENVSAQRAKLSGLFPLPGYPRPVDFTKLEGLVKTRLMDSNDILNENSSINPIDSRNSKVIIVDNIDFDKISYMKIVEYFNDTLKKIDIEETSVQNISKKWIAQDKKKLIVVFNNSTCATIILSLNTYQLPVAEFIKESNNEDEMDDEQASNTLEKTFRLSLGRPGEYVVQLLPKYTSIEVEDIFTKVIDSPRKITLILPQDLTETEIVDELKLIAPIKCFQLLREIGTKTSLGIAFVEFFVDPNQTNDKSTGDMIHLVQEMLDKVKDLSIIKNAFFSCINNNSFERTAIQDCPTSYETLELLVKNEQSTPHPKLRVIQLLNIVIARDLVDDNDFKFTENDIKRELSKFGRIVSMKIPRPANDYTPGLIQFSQPGLGKVYVEFEDETSAMNAIIGTAGRQFNDRTVLCAYFDYSDYKSSLL
ncbi:uncharacterized protein KQ657_003263 [Scheffersomyces spartinae]|uniref:RRM domain-containing protein n=1 Tax=Scheffersomyces spartinae TaxID=45513 RepID=A0A9P7VCW0_9ASCO|nr:uncharacterized protein KQ657_003263 [Scheffersomyces spartinae]KAG7195500.1 hypothetical protein KQ657_003263 [Scheffersomyces spartinae]